MKPIFQQIEFGRDRSLLAFEYRSTHFDAPWHFHPQHELTLIEESFGTKFIGNYVGPYAPGELVLVSSSLPHCWKDQNENGQDAHSIVVWWNDGIFSQIPEMKAVFNMLLDAQLGILFEKEQTQDVLKELRSLPSLNQQDLYVDLLRILLKLTHCRYETLSTGSFDRSKQSQGRMQKIHAFLDAHFDQKIYLRDLAALLNMSEQTFSRFFKKMMGRPFFTFLNEYRLNRASRMLINSQATVKEIAYASGYESLPYFYRAFKGFKGLSPLQYRRRHSDLKSDNHSEFKFPSSR